MAQIGKSATKRLRAAQTVVAKKASNNIAYRQNAVKTINKALGGKKKR